ncbi:hypothetical protein PACTADRAFT_40306 [Pachysolen tannophilus NRRL Y-2460]|uniref:Mannosyltransferase n=1 Tax=Pachysolen tannophilus NRRL Y-2460 TaxID=669874 RepID=A0A1E4TWE3_PACTA|nr:hypothetical protein PACTADRAFT_40306 [Pachysolen tannophilus NRRL Y-2460]
MISVKDNWAILDILLVGSILLHIYVSPYTKVEESFNIQAIYDLNKYGLFDLSKFDHNEFPGAVKRTFIGPMILALLLKPFTFFMDESKLVTLLDYQLVVRCILGLINGLMLIRLRNTLYNISVKGLNRKLSIFYGLFQYFQFHMVYYASRTLPNFIALPFVIHALNFCLQGDFITGFTWLAFTTIVFRVELCIFIFCLGFVSILSAQTPYDFAILTIFVGSVSGILATLFVDSYMWDQFPCLPELSSFYFNVVQGKSKDWGVEPFGAYFFKYFKTLFFPPIVPSLILPGLFFNTCSKVNTIRTIGLSSLLYVFLMSFQPHKEWRFIIYAIPGITMLGANGAVYVTTRSNKIFKFFFNVFIGISTVTAIASSTFMLYASSLNYPGGTALQILNERLIDKDFSLNNDLFMPTNKKNITIHMDVPACMTGITLFGEIQPDSLKNFKIAYDKTENTTVLLGNEGNIWGNFDYVITDLDIDHISEYNEQIINYKLYGAMDETQKWLKTGVVKGFGGVNINPLMELVRNYNLIIKLIEDILIRHDLDFAKRLLERVVVQRDMMFIYDKAEV